MDWKWFKRIIERNQILPLAYCNLQRRPAGCAGRNCLRSLREERLATAGHSMSQAAELVRITQSRRSGGFGMVALKGVALSALAYGNLRCEAREISTYLCLGPMSLRSSAF